MIRAGLRSICVLGTLLLVTPASTLADRLHLDGGGMIEADSWRVEGDWLYLERDGMTMGLPRATVVRIEPAPRSRGNRTPTTSSAAARPETAPLMRRSDHADLRRLVESAQASLEGREFQNAADQYHELLTAMPELHAARVGYAVSEMALGNDGRALAVVLDGLARDPERAELHEVLGDLRNREERVEDALGAWNRAFALAPSDRLRAKILKAQRELTAGRDYDFARTSHFNVRYDGEVDLSLANRIMDYLEEQYGQLSSLFLHTPVQPITVQLYPKREFREVTQAPDWVGGLYDGKIRVPLGGLRRLDSRSRGVLRHELAHAVIHSKTRTNCPRWLHEAVAQIVEGRHLSSADRVAVATHLAAGKPEDWESRGFNHHLALSLGQYLESRRGFDALVWLLDLLGNGRELDAALYEVYGFDYATICRRWAERVAEAGTR